MNYTFFSREVSKQSKRINKSQELRGTIYDRNMVVLATSMATESCYIETKKAKNFDISLFSECTNIPTTEIRTKLNQNKASVLIKRKLLPDEVLKIRAKNFPGVYFEKEQLRFYPEGSLANYVVGVVGTDNNGLSGIEYLFDDFLSTKAQQHTVIRDGRGREIALDNKSGDECRNIVLTIDSRLQHIAEKALEDAFQINRAKSLTCIIQNPYTGEILAMAGYPSYNPNKKIDEQMLKNPTISDAFEPGSVFKIVSASAAIEKLPNILKEKFFCENGSYKLTKNVIIHDHEKYKWLSFQDMLAYSSNIGFAKLSRKIGAENLWQYSRSFGFGMTTGIELVGEASGQLNPPNKWSGISCEMFSFGQELSATALQIINSFSVIANGGNLMEPKIIKSIIHDNKEIQKCEPVKIRTVILPQTTEIIKKMLEAVVVYGTGTQAKIDGIKIAGKTGTAQKYDKQLKKYSSTKYVSLFAGFLPADKPEITILVVVDEPTGDYWASSVAAPIFKKIALDVIEYLNIKQTDKCMG